MVDHISENPRVGGSIPPLGTKIGRFLIDQDAPPATCLPTSLGRHSHLEGAPFGA
jgi:hypothetical protein